jgi:hypothetical protein
MNRASQPKIISVKKFGIPPLLSSVLLLLCALTFYYFVVLRFDYSKTSLLNLDPQPDASEYFAQARSLLKDGNPSIQIGYDKLPSRYPFGYPVLMLPWLKILPAADAVLAPFRTNQTLGLLLLLAVFGFYAYLSMPLTGGFAALLLATLPGFFTFCRSSMSEISGSMLVVLAFIFAYLGLKQERRWKIYLSAILLGFSVNIRIQSLFFAPLLLAMALFPAKGMRVRCFFHCAAVCVVFVFAASPLLVLNTIQFKSPFRTGYDFWVPYWSEHHLLFKLRYIPTNLAGLWGQIALAPLTLHTANIFGTGAIFVPAFICLTCVGLFFIQINRFVICASLAELTYLITLLSHNDNPKLMDVRYYVPLAILLVAVAVLPVTWAAKNLFAKRRVLVSLGVFVLFGATCLGYPSRSVYNTSETDRSQAWDALHFTDPRPSSANFIAQRRFTKLLKGQSGIVFSDIDPVYLNSLLPKSFVAAPIDGNHVYKFSKIWRYDRPQALALVQHGLEQSLPVYALFISEEDMTINQSRLPAVPGYSWQALNNVPGKTQILKLAPVTGAQAASRPG